MSIAVGALSVYNYFIYVFILEKHLKKSEKADLKMV
jgi:hypothetical protein